MYNKHRKDGKKYMNHTHKIKEVKVDSIAMELGIEPGDKLLSINEKEVEDVFDYHFFWYSKRSFHF